MKNKNLLFGILIGISGIGTLYFTIKGNFNIAVLFMTAIFALSNTYRAISFKEKGYEREAKWMKNAAILFAILFLIVLGINIF